MTAAATLTRRHCLALFAAAALTKTGTLLAKGKKPLRGAFMILATPYTSTKAIDYEDLAAEVEFLDRCEVQGMVWPQNASDLNYLTKDERMRGMEVIAKAAKGRKPALMLGVQSEDTPSMLEYARLAEIANWNPTPSSRFLPRKRSPWTTTANTTPSCASSRSVRSSSRRPAALPKLSRQSNSSLKWAASFRISATSKRNTKTSRPPSAA